jgi:tetratricopeptide (TPR) repeat protein
VSRGLDGRSVDQLKFKTNHCCPNNSQILSFRSRTRRRNLPFHGARKAISNANILAPANRIQPRMTQSLRTALIFFYVLLLQTAVAAQPADSTLDDGLKLLEESRTTLDETALSRAQEYFGKLTQQHPENAVYFYELARVESYRSSAFSMRNDKKKAEHALDEAMASVQQSLKLNEKSPDAHSLLADLYGRKIGFGVGMFAGPKYGPKVKSENERAQELDPNSARVFASLGRQYFMAPHMFGGDIDKAVESLRKSTQLDPNFDETYVWLAIALRKKGDEAGAEQALQQALKLNPRSVFAKSTAEKH